MAADNVVSVGLRQALAVALKLPVESVPPLDSDLDGLDWGEQTPLRRALHGMLEHGEMEPDVQDGFVGEMDWPHELCPVDCVIEFGRVLQTLLEKMPDRRHDETGELVRGYDMPSFDPPVDGNPPPDNEGWSMTRVVRAERQITLGQLAPRTIINSNYGLRKNFTQAAQRT